MKQFIIQHLESAGITFVGFFLFSLCDLIAQDSFTFSKSALYAGIIGAVLAGVRAVAVIIYDLAKGLIQAGKNIDTSKI